MMSAIQRDVSSAYAAKLVLLGEATSGKTSLLQSLRGAIFEPDNRPTVGVNIRTLCVSHPYFQNNITYHVWDFGGERVFHATHQILLTEGATYMLLWSARSKWNQNGESLLYWLNILQSTVPQSPIMVVTTHIDEFDHKIPNASRIPIETIKREFPAVVGSYQISNVDRTGVADLLSEIIQITLDNSLMLELNPKHWDMPMMVVDDIGFRKNLVLSFDQFFHHLRQRTHDISSAKVHDLIDFLHRMGSIFYLENLGQRLIIVHPEAVFQAVGQLMADRSRLLSSNNGVVDSEIVDRTWPYLSTQSRKRIIDVMQVLQLCFVDTTNKSSKFVIPQYRSADPPEFLDAKWSSIAETATAKEVTRKYAFAGIIPAGIPERFFATVIDIADLTIWKNGAMLSSKTYANVWARLELVDDVSQNSRALVIRVRGENPYRFLEEIESIFKPLLPSHPTHYELIPCPCQRFAISQCNSEYAVEPLKSRELTATVQCHSSWTWLSVEELLFGSLVADPTNVAEYSILESGDFELNEVIRIGAKIAASSASTPRDYLVDLINRTSWPSDWKTSLSGIPGTDPLVSLRKIVNFAASKGTLPDNPSRSALVDILNKLLDDLGAEDRAYVEAVLSRLSNLSD